VSAEPTEAMRRRGLYTWGAALALLAAAPFVSLYPVFMLKAMCRAIFACAFNLLAGLVTGAPKTLVRGSRRSLIAIGRTGADDPARRHVHLRQFGDWRLHHDLPAGVPDRTGRLLGDSDNSQGR
jgi:hypothetical protein